MTSYKPLLLLTLLLCMIGSVKAQTNDTAAAEIIPQIENNQVKFGASFTAAQANCRRACFLLYLFLGVWRWQL